MEPRTPLLLLMAGSGDGTCNCDESRFLNILPKIRFAPEGVGVGVTLALPYMEGDVGVGVLGDVPDDDGCIYGCA